jgi:ABC-type multidrug transport system fused ATPase/permease subunit
MADSIIVLQHGTIAEHGTHEELVRLNGLYAELFNLQASGYR